MNGLLRRLWPCALIAVLLLLPARAENPKVSIKLQDATFGQALDALSQASGLKLGLARRPQRPEEVPDPLPPGLETRASFDWTDVRFAVALRQLCTRYGLLPLRTGEGYTLVNVVLPAGPEEVYGLTEKNGARIFVSALRVRKIGAFNGRPEKVSLQVTISCDWPDGDAEAITAMENVRASDDQGNILEPDRSRGFVQRFFPDQQAIAVSFQDPDPRAKRLRWLDADVMIRPRHRRMRMEAPIASKPTRTVHEDAVVEVMPLTVPGPQVRNPLPAGARQLVTRLTVHPPDGLKCNIDSFLTPELVGVSGTVYRGTSTSSQHYKMDGEGLICEITNFFPPLPERPVKVMLGWREEAPQEKLFSVRMTDIPLPPVGGPPPPAQTMEPPAVTEASIRRPFYRKGGGTLTVSTADKPASVGVVSLGLSAKDGDDWSALRWLDVPIGPGGIARLTDVRPGTYRVSRSYRRDKAAPAGRPVGAPVEVQVEAGKEVTLPRLE